MRISQLVLAALLFAAPALAADVSVNINGEVYTCSAGGGNPGRRNVVEFFYNDRCEDKLQFAVSISNDVSRTIENCKARLRATNRSHTVWGVKRNDGICENVSDFSLQFPRDADSFCDRVYTWVI